LAEALASQGRMFYLQASADTDSVKKAQHYDSALVVLRQAVSYDAECKGVYGQMSRVHDKAGRLDSAVYYVELQLAKGEDATEFSRQISLLQRKNAQARLIEVLEPVTADTAMLARYGLILANAYIETNAYAKAKQMIAQVIQHQPDNCDAHQLNAYIDLKRERYSEAIPALIAGVRACPKNADMWLYLGDCYYFSDPKKKDVVTKAQEAYQRACALGSRDGCEKRDQISEVVKTLR